MELYTTVSYELSRHLTLRYSTSFGQSTKLFDKSIRAHIFAIYGLVRIADEIVDSYQGNDRESQLKKLEDDVDQAIRAGYSANPIVHCFALTVRKFKINQSYIRAFFASMELDLSPKKYTAALYKAYIYGSAEVIGLMCLAIFTSGDRQAFKRLEAGARALGAAYQKINFLRDIASDYHGRQRYYFPKGSFDTFDDNLKQAIIADIKNDLQIAKPSLRRLPANARRAVMLSYVYYGELLKKLAKTPAELLLIKRVRVSNFKKFIIFASSRDTPLQQGTKQ